jgi:hypothetical protein
MTSSLRIIVTGLIAQHPTLGGVAWDYLQYVVGLARLGHEVYYVEDSGEWPYSPDGGPSGNDWVARDPSPNVSHLASVMARFDLGERWAYRFPTGSRWFGLANGRRKELFRSADLLINVSGTLDRPGEYRQVRCLVYIDSDPVFTQIRLASKEPGFGERVDAHDVHMSFGECLSEAVPETGHSWRPTRQPVVLSEWRPATPRREAFTTVMSWTSYEPLVYAGRTYGQKDRELRRFLDLPARLRPEVLEVALNRTHHVNWQSGEEALPTGPCEKASPGAQASPKELLTRAGWQVVDADEVCFDLDSYRLYIESSKGEWSVAKNGYVAGRPGWFSCRSACYLAAGRPVVVQDTGFAAVIPVGKGVLTFRDPDEAAAAVCEVRGNYERHAKQARSIAETYFDSDKVLSRLIEVALNHE